MTMHVPKFAKIVFHEEAHVDFDGDSMFTSDQKSLIEKDKDEDVTEFAPPSRYLSASGRTPWFTFTTS